jgi:hypothetical protein
MGQLGATDPYRVIEWDDPRGDVGWAVIDQQGRVVSKHMTRLSAVAAVERREEAIERATR